MEAVGLKFGRDNKDIGQPKKRGNSGVYMLLSLS